MFSLPFNVKQSIQINKSIEEVFSVVSNFNTWHHWSPWLCMEPDCPVEIDGSAGELEHTQKWHGKRIGTGEMILSRIVPNQRLEYDLTFLKPWKSNSKVTFEFKSNKASTQLTWYMEGDVPVFLFFMRKMMSAMVASDYQRGLVMLKEFLETGTVNSKIKFTGEVSCAGFYYLGIHRHCATSEVGPAMQQDFEQLHVLMSQNKLKAPEFMFSFYHKYDLVNQACEYTSGFAYKSEQEHSTYLVSGNIPSHSALNIEHIGSYRHLGNGWSAIQSMLRASKRKQSKTIPMYEIYINFPGQVEESDIRTSLYLPLK